LCLLAGSTWGAHASVLRTSALALVYSAAEYAAPAWCRDTHSKKLDVALNNTLRIISGCLKLTRMQLAFASALWHSTGPPALVTLLFQAGAPNTAESSRELEIEGSCPFLCLFIISTSQRCPKRHQKILKIA